MERYVTDSKIGVCMERVGDKEYRAKRAIRACSLCRLTHIGAMTSKLSCPVLSTNFPSLHA